jgi:hypothetical protein
LCADIVDEEGGLGESSDRTSDLHLFQYNENGSQLMEFEWNWGKKDIQIWNILVWGTNQSMFSGGQFRDVDSGKELNFLIKWDLTPQKLNISLIVGLSAGGFVVLVTAIWFFIWYRRRKKQKK